MDIFEPTEQTLDMNFESWLFRTKTDIVKETMSPEQLKFEVETEMRQAKALSVEQRTLYEKWCEIQRRKNYETSMSQNDLFGNNTSPIEELKNKLWYLKSLDDYQTIRPILIKSDKDWELMRCYCSSFVNNGFVGRNLKYVVMDKTTEKYLGLLCVGSDFLVMGARDKYIGWTTENRTKDKTINHTGIGAVIIPTQPFGYLFTGGKLLALLICSDQVRNDWLNKYGDLLVGMTTTSLYGSFSQYSGLKYWKNVGETLGTQMIFTPSPELRKKIDNYMELNYPRVYWEYTKATALGGSQPLHNLPKTRFLMIALKKLGVDMDISVQGYHRGIFFNEFYTNTREFLRKEITEKELILKYQASAEILTDLWKTKYASKRVNSLRDKTDLDYTPLCYSDLKTMTWNETEHAYLHKLGNERNQKKEGV